MSQGLSTSAGITVADPVLFLFLKVKELYG
jgi:hypothetical protein